MSSTINQIDKTMNLQLYAPSRASACIPLPASKSISNRALLIAALCGGEPQVVNPALCDDTAVMVDALARSGSDMTIDVVTLITIILNGRTPMPTIEVEEHSNYYLITANGNGEVLLYINGEPVSNPYYLYFGNEEQLVHITATAREGQKAISETATRDLYVPANW